MGQQFSQQTSRRRLGEKADYGWKPFGEDGWDYGYPEEWMRTSSFSIWALVTAGSFAVDWREAAVVLGGAVWAQEKRLPLTLDKENEGKGASWVHNVQAGYCLYHYWVRGNKKMLVFLATLVELGADAVAWSGVWGKFDNAAHLEGLVEGFVVAFILDGINRRKIAAY